MDILFLGVVVFLFLLAVFHLSVGVSNDAVNFLTSAVGSRAASFSRVEQRNDGRGATRNVSSGESVVL